jgi:hypothetical protein
MPRIYAVPARPGVGVTSRQPGQTFRSSGIILARTAPLQPGRGQPSLSVQTGIDHAKEKGKRLGRPRVGEGKNDRRTGVSERLRAELAAGTSLRQTAQKLGISLSTVKRVRRGLGA